MFVGDSSYPCSLTTSYDPDEFFNNFYWSTLQN